MAINRKQRIKTAYLLSGTTTIKLMKRMQTTWMKKSVTRQAPQSERGGRKCEC